MAIAYHIPILPAYPYPLLLPTIYSQNIPRTNIKTDNTLYVYLPGYFTY